MKKFLKDLFVAIKDTFRYVALPTAIIVFITVAFDIKVMMLSAWSTASVFGFLSITYGIFKYDQVSQIKAASKAAERSAKIAETAEMLKRQAEERRQSELAALWWEENFATVCSWREDIGR